MKTLAIAGAVCGGGAMSGIVVVGVAGIAVRWGVMAGVKKLRSRSET